MKAFINRIRQLSLVGLAIVFFVPGGLVFAFEFSTDSRAWDYCCAKSVKDSNDARRLAEQALGQISEFCFIDNEDLDDYPCFERSLTVIRAKDTWTVISAPTLEVEDPSECGCEAWRVDMRAFDGRITDMRRLSARERRRHYFSLSQ